MKKLKELRVSLIKTWAQPLADFIIKKMKETQNENEFKSLYTMGLYLDFYCEKKGLYLD
jgi:hypothetical protein